MTTTRFKTRRDGTRSKQSKQRTRDYRQARRIKYYQPEGRN